MVLRSVILIPGFLFVLQPLLGLVYLAPLTVAFLMLSVTKYTSHTVPIRSQLTFFFFMQNLFGHLALLPLSISPFPLYPLLFCL